MILESENALLLQNFIEENWQQFCEWMAERGQSEADAQTICDQLDEVVQKG